jgi:hypothetical protein
VADFEVGVRARRRTMETFCMIDSVKPSRGPAGFFRCRFEDRPRGEGFGVQDRRLVGAFREQDGVAVGDRGRRRSNSLVSSDSLTCTTSPVSRFIRSFPSGSGSPRINGLRMLSLMTAALTRPSEKMTATSLRPPGLDEPVTHDVHVFEQFFHQRQVFLERRGDLQPLNP